MAPESLCQECGATFSASSQKKLKAKEYKHYTDSFQVKKVNYPVKMIVEGHQCRTFDLFDDIEEKVGYRRYENWELAMEDIWSPLE